MLLYVTAVPPMYSTQEMLTITLSDSEEGGDAASKGSSSYAQKSMLFLFICILRI